VDLGAYEFSPDHDLDGTPDWLDPDDDDDGATDAADCAPFDPLAWTAPVEVGDLVASAPAVLDWTAQGADVLYDVVSGLLSELHADGGFGRAGCRDTNVAVPTWTETLPDPAPGSGTYYLVRAGNACGDGGWGASSDGLREVGVCP
jgi:hypothetical protein